MRGVSEHQQNGSDASLAAARIVALSPAGKCELKSVSVSGSITGACGLKSNVFKVPHWLGIAMMPC